MKENRGLMTEGVIWKQLLLFALPLLLGNLFQQFYNTVDSIVVGNYIGANALASVGASTPIVNLMVGMFTGLGTGAGVVIAQFFGAKDHKGVHDGVHTTIALCLVSGLVMAVVGVALSPIILRLLDTPAEIMEGSVTYLQIYFMGVMALMIYNMGSGILRAVGDSRTPLFTVAVACVFNIAGDLILCAGFKMGTSGAAFATVFAQVISVIVSFGVIRKKELPFEMHKTDIGVHGRTLRKMVGLGAPIALQDLLVSISFLIILAIVNSMGVTASAGVGVAEKVCAFIMLISSAFMQSISAFVAQNYGAGRMDRAKKALHYGGAVSFAIGVGMFFLSFFHGNVLAGIFSSDAMVIEAAADYLKAYAIDCLFTAIFFCYIGFYNGIGMTKFVMIQGIIGAFCVRVPVSWFMSRRAGATLFDIGLATPFSSILQLVLCLGCMLYLRKKKWV